MAYITHTYSGVTGQTVLAATIQSAFVAFTDGLSDGASDLNVNALTTAATLTVGADLTTSGEYRCDGVDAGGKYWFPVARVYSETSPLDSQASGYVGNGYSVRTTSVPVRMFATGSVRAVSVQYSESMDLYDEDFGSGVTFGVQVRVNDVAISSSEVGRGSFLVGHQVVTFARGAASFTSGSYISAYVVSNVSDSRTLSQELRVAVEVQYDV